ncbi:MAG TPA: hypothetical protein VMU29_07045 [Smithella sp.]|nr:hypothetical protein [Smithella sp.]
MDTKHKRLMGQILLDGRFVSPSDIDFALAEQKRTRELLGQVLVRTKVLEPADVSAVMSLQTLLNEAKDVVKTAAGVRLMLGEMLVQAGHITNLQLEQALTEQRQTGEKLGEILIRMGLLTRRQLEGLLDFQFNQSAVTPAASPLRLGELLISTGVISREQLKDALLKQSRSDKKLGEVLVEEGYAKPHHIKRGVRLQTMLVTAALVALLAACGGGGGADPAPADTSNATTTTQTAANVDDTQITVSAIAYDNQITLTEDDYGLKAPTFYYSTNNASFWSIQANIAANVDDVNSVSVIRIDIPVSESTPLPDITGQNYSIEANGAYQEFPGTFMVFNGQISTNLKVISGTISFTSNSTIDGIVEGTFNVIMVDDGSTEVPLPQYRLVGTFNFEMGTYGPPNTAPSTASNTDSGTSSGS